MTRWTSFAGNRPALLLLTLVLLLLALFLPAVPPAAAAACSPGCFPSTAYIYYTDATRQHILCYLDCETDTCDNGTSPWFRTHSVGGGETEHQDGREDAVCLSIQSSR